MAASAEVADYPKKPIHMVVPSTAGAGADILARLVADKLGKTVGQPVVVENKPGASSVIGTTTVARAQPDGYTILFTWTALVQSSVQKTKPPYDVFTDLAPVAEVARSSFVLIGATSAQIGSVTDIIAMAKQRPGQYSYGSYGNGTSSHILGELFKQSAGISMVHVPYRGGAPLLSDLQAGHIPVAFLDFASARANAGNERLRMLAITSSERSPYFKTTPTFGELGIRGLDIEGWFGILAPGKTDPAIVKKLSVAVGKSLHDPEVAKRMEELGVTIVGNSPNEFAAKLRRDEEKWRTIITNAAIRAD
ncbi:Bug family tripartite tricarboxylate transporter substrate binding protein [Cupriavidus sp. USMAA2-4]|uniref:Bug family tripartite tricarboxylate transporter substrate binding protein n=1 Tax=Cupriavidus sp. USMAA2-4 TaxID=876364 RepID=UPI0009FE7D4D|nr:tripartite tricarboxylate transporter substrate binding protein [Cupriavidus sp. USMAA2-4]